MLHQVSHRALTCISVPATEDLSSHSEGECWLCFGYSDKADWSGGHLILLLVIIGVFTSLLLLFNLSFIYFISIETISCISTWLLLQWLN